MESIWLILALTVVTYLTRCSGHVIVSRFGALHPRVRAALDAVPAAVITTIVLQPVIEGGLAERVAFGVAVVVGMRFSLTVTLLIGLGVLVVMRQVLV
ncbi:MAG: AzlD domain-containing protein [Pseudomonadota bacterium]